MDIQLATKEHLSQIEPLYQALFATTADLEPYFFKKAHQDQFFWKRPLKMTNQIYLLL